MVRRAVLGIGTPRRAACRTQFGDQICAIKRHEGIHEYAEECGVSQRSCSKLDSAVISDEQQGGEASNNEGVHKYAEECGVSQRSCSNEMTAESAFADPVVFRGVKPSI